VPEVAQEPPEPRRAALAGLVVRDDPGLLPDAGAAGGRLEVRGIGQRMATALAGLARQVAVDVDERGAGNVSGEPQGLARARLPEHVAAVHDGEPGLAEVLAEPGGLDQRAEGCAHGRKARARRAPVLRRTTGDKGGLTSYPP
jgi:hypothetical protein